MNRPVGNLRNDTRAWVEVPADDNGDAMIAAMAEAGVEYIFFTSGSEIGFYQEAVAKAHAQGRKAPKLITVTHEHASLNAALGYAAVSGRPAVTAAHVDCGTQHYGGAVHTAFHSGLPIMITGGGSPTSFPGSGVFGHRDGGGHIWLQQSFDQNSIVRQYTKWDHRMQLQDNSGLMISRALQVACTEPRGPVYLTLPREVSLHKVKGAKFPTMQQLGVAKPAAPDPDGIREIAQRLIEAQSPFVLTARSGRNPATVPALVRLCELLGLPVAQSGLRAYQCFPLNHPLYMSEAPLKDADVVLCLDVDIPWLADTNPPPDSAWVAITDVEPAKRRIPTMEFTADLRLTADALAVIEALEAEARKLITPDDARRFAARAAKCAELSGKRRRDLAEDAKSRASKNPIDPKWLSHCIGQVIDDNCIVFDETIAQNQVHDYLGISRPGSYFHNPASSGGWTPGAAFGAKLAAPDRDVIAVSGDGFYMFGTPVHALWAARHYNAPYMSIVFQNRSYSTGTLRINRVYGAEHSYAAKANYDGGYFDPPIDFAKEAEAAGAYGENVTDPAEVEPALRRGLARIRAGQPTVISVWLARLLQKD